MSVDKKEIITKVSYTRQIISIIIVAGILFGIYIGSTALMSLFFDERLPPSDELAEAEEEDVLLMPIEFDLTDLLGLLDPELVEKYAQEVVFYIGEYEIFDDSWLWKFAVSDEYSTAGTWSQSTSGDSPTNFMSQEDYNGSYSSRDMLKIRMPIEPRRGINSVTAPALFPTPHIMNRPWVEPYTENFSQDSTVMFKDSFNVASLNLNFNQAQDVTLSYNMFGEGFLKLSELAALGLDVHPVYSPADIKNQYLQVPGGVAPYIFSNPNFKKHYDALNLLIAALSTDTTTTRSDTIREYLVDNFNLNIYPPYTRPSQGQDVVEWFCERGEGIFSDFAATYVILARCFGVPCRYVEGFNSRYAESVVIPEEDNPNFYSIRRLNLYAWAEIYVPSAIDGSGNWTEVDVYFGEEATPQQLELTVFTDKLSTVQRGEQINITARLSSSGTPLSGYTIDFRDVTEDVILGEEITNIQGECSILFTPNASNIVGIHQIEATQGFNINYTAYVLEGPIQVNLDGVNPDIIDKTIFDNTTIIGDLYDPVANKGVENGLIRFLLLTQSSSEVSNAFLPNTRYSDNNGNFTRELTVNDNVGTGDYFTRADFNGTFHVESAFVDFSFDATVPSINDSSDLVSLNVINPDMTSLDFYIEDIANDIYENPQVSQSANVNLKAYLYSESAGALAGEIVNFYDITAGTEASPEFIDTAITNGAGLAEITYDVDSHPWNPVAGPHLLYAESGTVRNHSYFVIQSDVNINLNPPRPIPNEIDRSGAGTTTFNLKGSIVDAIYGDPIENAVINFSLVQGGQIFHTELQAVLPNTNPNFCGTDGQFDINFDVDDNILPGNYTVKADFNGSFFYNYADFPHTFALTTINATNSTTLDLQINAPDYFIFNFWINNTPSSNYLEPVVNRSQNLNLSVYLQSGASPLIGETVSFYDITNNSFIGSDDTDSYGYASFLYDLDSGILAGGPHLIRAVYGPEYNYSYFILNESIYVDLISGPTPSIINRSTSYDYKFNIHGYVRDKQNDLPVINTRVYIQMLDASIETPYLNWSEYTVGPTGEFNLDFEVDDATPPKNYTLNIVVDEVFDYTSAPFPYRFNLAPNNHFENSTNGFQELKVLDPYNITIDFWINGTAALPNYLGANYPLTFNRSHVINFTARLDRDGSPVGSGIARLYDLYENRLIAANSISGGMVEFITQINDSWVVGPHKIMILYQLDGYDFENYTFVVLNGTKKVEINADTNSVTRNVEWITVSGCVNDTYSNLKVKQVLVRIILLNKTFDDLSSKLDFDVGYTQTDLITSFTSWNYEFRFKIDITTPVGEYYIRVDFNGTISDFTAPIFISQSNFMTSNSSELWGLNVSAGSQVINGFFNTTSGIFVEGETIKIWGYLRYDNGTDVANALINITIRDIDGNDLYWNDTESTNGSGYFYVEIVVPPGYTEDSVNIVYLGENWVSGIDEDLPRS